MHEGDVEKKKPNHKKNHGIENEPVFKEYKQQMSGAQQLFQC